MRRYAMGSLGPWLALAAVALAGEPPPGPPFVVPISADGVQRTSVTLDSYSYQPSHLIVEAGKPVELTLTSVTTFSPHMLQIEHPAGGQTVEHDVGAGKTVVVNFTTSPKRASP